jgi:6-phosphogluconate dehydrogenase (decarboxylating)
LSWTAEIRTITTTSGGQPIGKPSELHYVDAGASSGIWGKERGYCRMIGQGTKKLRYLITLKLKDT